MITPYDWKSSSMYKPFRQFQNNCIKFHKEVAKEKIDAPEYIVRIGKYNLNVLLPILQLAALTHDPESWKDVGKRIGEGQLEDLSHISEQSTKYTQFITQRRLSYRKEPDEEFKVDNYTIHNLGFSVGSDVVYNSMLSLLNTDTEFVGQITAEISSLAIMLMTNSRNDVYVNPININLLVIYYWVCKQSTLTQSRMQFINAIPEHQGVNYAVRTDESFQDFLRRQIKDKYAQDTAIQHFRKFLSSKLSQSMVYYSMFDRYITSTFKQIEGNKRIATMYETYLRSLDNYIFLNAVPKLRNEKMVRRLACAIMTGSVAVYGFHVIQNRYVLALYLLYQCIEKERKMGLTDKELSLVVQLANGQAADVDSTSMRYGYNMLQTAIPVALNRIRDFESEQKKAQGREEKLQASLSEVKSKYKEETKSTRELTKENKRIKSELAKARSIAESNIKPEELEAAKDRIKVLETDINTEAKRSKSLERDIRDYVKNIEQLKSELKKSEEDFLNLVEESDRLKKLTSEISSHRIYNEIPLECFINSIKDYKIVIIGGDSMHTELKKLGLSNLRLFKAGCKSVTLDNIINMDLVVIATSYVDHSSIEAVIKGCRTHKIKLLKYNTLNAEGLVYSIFQEMTK